MKDNYSRNIFLLMLFSLLGAIYIICITFNFIIIKSGEDKDAIHRYNVMMIYGGEK